MQCEWGPQPLRKWMLKLYRDRQNCSVGCRSLENDKYTKVGILSCSLYKMSPDLLESCLFNSKVRCAWKSLTLIRWSVSVLAFLTGVLQVIRWPTIGESCTVLLKAHVFLTVGRRWCSLVFVQIDGGGGDYRGRRGSWPSSRNSRTACSAIPKYELASTNMCSKVAMELKWRAANSLFYFQFSLIVRYSRADYLVACTVRSFDLALHAYPFI